MSSDDARISAIFEAALAREGEERVSFVRNACAGDAGLLRRVEEMLARAEGSLLIDRPVGHAIAELLEAGDDPDVLIGTMLDEYRVESLLGVGGMGEVYRGFDTKLQRPVAIKVLPSSLAADPDRLARLQREAVVLGQLTHPHIAAVYRSVHVGSVAGIVMELVDGHTLAELIAKGQLPLDEALPIARQIAEALEAAHEQGIVHRDLKPANIKVCADGSVRVLDFGLAKVATLTPAAGVAGTSAITTPALTQAGVLLGTAAYMSPEQARGREADKRSDVWAYGCVLYEMLAGRRAFGVASREPGEEGAGVADTLAAVLRGEPDWDAIPSAVPSGIVALIKACLTKDRRGRLGGMAGVLFALDHAPALTAGATTAVRRDPRSRWRAAVLGVGAAAAGALVMVVANRVGVQQVDMPVTRVSLTLPAGVRLTGQGVALSPDGRTVIVPAGNRLLSRRLDRDEFVPLAGTEGATYPFFSPDGQWVGFVASGALRKVRADGSTPLLISQIGTPWAPPTWGPADTIVFGVVGAGLFRVSGNGGTPVAVTQPRRDTGEVGHTAPQWLPDGKRVLFTITHEKGPLAAIVDVATGTWEELPRLEPAGGVARYIESGHLVFGGAGTLFAVPYRPGERTFRVAPVPVATNVAGTFTVTDAGAMAFVPTDATPSLTSRTGRIALVDRTGAPLPIVGPEVITVNGSGGNGFSFSPDGTRFAVPLVRVGRTDRADVWIYDLERQNRIRVTDQAILASLTWAADDEQVLFNWTRNPPGLWAQAPDPAAMPRLVLPRETFAQIPYAWAKDGTVVFGINHPQTGWDIWLVQPNGQPAPLQATAAQEPAARLSRDGRWLAYESDMTGQSEVYVRRLVGTGATQIVSAGGGTDPRWVGANELIYRRGREVLTVPLAPDGERLRIGTARRLFEVDDYANRYDVSPDGARFALLMRPPDTEPGQVNLVLNWFEELRRLVPAN